MTIYRIVGWNIDEAGALSVRDIREFGPARTSSGTHRKIGREIVGLLEERSVDYVKVEKLTEI